MTGKWVRGDYLNVEIFFVFLLITTIVKGLYFLMTEPGGLYKQTQINLKIGSWVVKIRVRRTRPGIYCSDYSIS